MDLLPEVPTPLRHMRVLRCQSVSVATLQPVDGTSDRGVHTIFRDLLPAGAHISVHNLAEMTAHGYHTFPTLPLQCSAFVSA